MKRCSYCGRENGDAADRCLECGTQFPSDDSSPADGSYEFTEAQDRMISSVASSMRIVGLVLVLLGGFQLLVALVEIMGRAAAGFTAAGPEGILVLVMGGFTMQAGTAFRKIVSSRGNDIGHLMQALRALRSLYRLQLVIFTIAAILLVLAFVVTLNGNG